METFAQRKAALERLGWTARVEREYRGKPGEGRREHDLELFSSVDLPLTARDWCRLCMEEDTPPAVLRVDERDEEGRRLYEHSENVGWDDDLKPVQRKVNEWFFGGGSCSVEGLVEVGDILRGHWGDDVGENAFAARTPEQLAEAVDAFIQVRDNPVEGAHLTAWGKIALMYHLVRDHYTPGIPEAAHENYPEIEAAFGTVGHMSWALGVRELFGFAPENGTQMSATFQMMLARFLPALRTVYTKISELVPGPVEGWALIDRNAGDGEIAENGLGLCVFSTRADCEHLIRMWEQTEEAHEDEVCTPRKLRERSPVRERIGIRPVRISVENGIEFLDDGVEPKVRPPISPERRPHWLEEPMESVDGLFEQWVKKWTWGDRDQHPREYDAAYNAWVEAAKFFGRGGAAEG